MRNRKKAAPKPPTTAVMALAKLIAIKRAAPASHSEPAKPVILIDMAGNRYARIGDAQRQQNQLLRAAGEILLDHVQDQLARQVEKHGADDEKGDRSRATMAHSHCGSSFRFTWRSRNGTVTRPVCSICRPYQ